MVLEEFCHKISYQFKNKKLLIEALTHPSTTKRLKEANYQRLEFFGDKIISFVVAEFLLNNFKDDNEGFLSKKHANIVSGEILAQIGFDLTIDKYIKLSKGEELTGGRKNKRIIENALEALVGAVYLDSDIETTKKFILKNFENYLTTNTEIIDNPISYLQEFVQSKIQKLPKYELVKTDGVDHRPIFTMKVIIDLKIISLDKVNNSNIEYFKNDQDIIFMACGNSKKESQKNAAKIAINYLKK